MKKETRREFLVNLIMGGGILSAFVLFIFNIAKYIYPKLGAPTFRKVVIAKADEIELGQVKEVRFGDQILYLANINGKYKVFFIDMHSSWMQSQVGGEQSTIFLSMSSCCV